MRLILISWLSARFIIYICVVRFSVCVPVVKQGQSESEELTNIFDGKKRKRVEKVSLFIKIECYSIFS